MGKKIVIDISPEAKIHVETDEYKGEACVTEIKKLFENFLEIDEFENKEEYYEQDEQNISGVNITK